MTVAPLFPHKTQANYQKGEAWLYLFSVIVNAVNLFMQVFFTIMYSDLEVPPHSASDSVC
jgi:hypothetical protein